MDFNMGTLRKVTVKKNTTKTASLVIRIKTSHYNHILRCMYLVVRGVMKINCRWCWRSESSRSRSSEIRRLCMSCICIQNKHKEREYNYKLQFLDPNTNLQVWLNVKFSAMLPLVWSHFLHVVWLWSHNVSCITEDIVDKLNIWGERYSVSLHRSSQKVLFY